MSGPQTAQGWAVPDYGPVETLTLAERPVGAPSPGELLVEVEAVGLNPLDLKIIGGVMKAVMPAPMPYVPGSDLVGRVVAAGEGAAAKAGARIVVSTWNGGLARRALIPADAHVAEAPPSASAADLAALPMAGLTGLHILRELGEVSGSTVAVLGATGGVGLMLVQMAAAAGATVVASRAGEDDDALLRANGARETVDYRGEGFVAALRRAAPGGVDAMVDLVTQFDALLGSAEAVRDGGLLLSTVFGPDPSAFGDRIHMRYVRLKAQPGDLARVVSDYAAGRLKANVWKRFGFDEAVAAYRALRDEHVRGKVVVTL